MNVNAIILQHKRVCNLIMQRKVKQSLDILDDMLGKVTYGGLRDEYVDLSNTYRSMIRYTVDGVKDPGRQSVYLRLLQSILRLNDRVKQDILAHHSGWYTYSVRSRQEKEEKLRPGSLIQSIDDLVFKSQLDELLASAEIRYAVSGTDEALARNTLTEQIFYHLWLTDYYGEAEESLIDIVRKSGKFHWYETASFVSALTLSSLRVWDTAKIKHLASLYDDQTQHVSERALTGIVLSLYYYDDRVKLYPEIEQTMKDLSARRGFADHCRTVVIQAIRSRETEKLSRRMNEDIIPKVVKLKPKIEEKLDLNALLDESMIEGRNPDWSDMFKDSEEVFKTMEELANLQMQGSDVYMSAFAGLKNFEFFRELRNWFVPFYPDHEAVDVVFHDEILGPGINELSEALFRTPYICNSDKFSLVLNMGHLPSEQKSLMLKAFRMELEGLEQMKYDNELTDPGTVFRTTVTQYIHDLYRFYKLSDFRNEFDDLFSSRLDVYNSLLYKNICGSPDADRSLADYFFSNEYYDDALAMYLQISSVSTNDAQLYEKAGYCYQQKGDFSEALKQYTLASIIDPKPWTLRKAGLCLRKLGRTKEALESYLNALKSEPDDLNTILMTAHCYLDLEEYDEALKHYFRIEYDNPANVKVLRPIAWCYLTTGRLREASRYFGRLAESEITAQDMINMGHLCFCEGDTRKASEYYIDSLREGRISAEAFINIYNDDSDMLVRNGVNPDDLPIVLDHVLFSRTR